MKVCVTIDIEYSVNTVHSKEELNDMAQFIAEFVCEKYYQTIVGEVEVDILEVPTDE